MRISDWSSDVCSSDLEKGRDHAHEAEAENPLADAAEIVGVHRHDAADEHHERSDRADERPDAGIYEVIVMMFRTGHGVFPVFSSPGMTLPQRPPALFCILFAAFACLLVWKSLLNGKGRSASVDR